MNLANWEIVALACAAIIWLLPVIMVALRRANWTPRVLFASIMLRGLAVASLLTLYFFGGIRQEEAPSLSKVRLNVLVDVSSSVVDERRGADGATYVASIQGFLDALQADTKITLEPTIYAFARQIEQVSLPVLAEEFAAVQQRLGKGSSQLTAAIDFLRQGNANDQVFTVLISDGKASLHGQDESSDQHQALIAAVRQNIPVLTVPVSTHNKWWHEEDQMPRMHHVAISTRQTVGNLASMGVSAAVRDGLRVATSFLKMFVGDQPLVPKNEWSCGLNKSRSAGRIVITPSATTSGPDSNSETVKPNKIQCDQLLVELPVEDGLQQLSIMVAKQWRVFDSNALPPSTDLRNYFVKNAASRRVLLVDGDKDGAELFLSRMFKSNDWVLEELAPGRIRPKTDFMNYDLVVFNEVSPVRLAKDEKERQLILHNLEQYVLQGGGFVLIGGKETYGHQGYAGSDIVDILPVTLDPKGSSGEPPLLVTVVMDVSASIIYDKDASARAIAYIESSLAPLSKGSHVQIIGFSDDPHPLVPLHAYESAEQTTAKLKKGLDSFFDEAERRRAIGLQPEGIHLYDAMYHALRPILPARLGELPVKPLPKDLAELPQRMLMVVDASDVDPRGLVHWWVDDDGRYFSETVRELSSRAAKKGVVINMIGMVQGEHNAEQMRRRWEFVKKQLPTLNPNDKNRVAAFKKMMAAYSALPELLKVAEASGGAAYLDQYDIPLGQMSRPMRDHITAATKAEAEQGHLFLRFGKDKKSNIELQVPGHALVAQRREAEVAAWFTDFKIEGLDNDLALWSSWVVTRDADKDSRGQVTAPAFGGRVVSYIASLRDTRANDAEHRKRFYHAWRRAMKWASRPQAREQFQLTVHKSESGKALSVRTRIESLDGLAVKSLRVKTGRGRSTEQQIDIMNLGKTTTTKAGEWMNMQRQIDGWWYLLLPLPKSDEEDAATVANLSLFFEADAARVDGRDVRLTESAAVEVALLQPIEEPLNYYAGADVNWLQQLAQSTKGAVLDITKPAWPDSLPLSQREITTPVETRWVWLFMLVFALALLADLLLRVMTTRDD